VAADFRQQVGGQLQLGHLGGGGFFSHHHVVILSRVIASRRHVKSSCS
jgi:hypothetical protein